MNTFYSGFNDYGFRPARVRFQEPVPIEREPDMRQLLTDEQRAFVLERYGKQVQKGRLQFQSEFAEAGVTIKSIAAELGCSTGPVSKVLKRARNSR